jgi:hypothetical protein
VVITQSTHFANARRFIPVLAIAGFGFALTGLTLAVVASTRALGLESTIDLGVLGLIAASLLIAASGFLASALICEGRHRVVVALSASRIAGAQRMTIWQRIWGFWLWLLTRLGLRTQTFRTVHVADIPEALQAEKVYVAGEDGYAWSAAMLCPGAAAAGRCDAERAMNKTPGLLRDFPRRCVHFGAVLFHFRPGRRKRAAP